MARSPILDATAEVAPYDPAPNPYLLRSESSATGLLILDLSVPDFDSYLKITDAGQAILESPAQVLIDAGGQVSTPELAALALLTSVANRVPYFTGSGTAALATFTAAGRTLVALSNSASLVTLAGLTPSATGLNLIVLGAPDFDSYLKITTLGAAVMESPAQVLLDAGGSLGLNSIVRVYVGDATVLTTGSPADIGSVALPTWLTRYLVPNIGSTLTLYAETAAGTLAGATFTVRDGPGGTGTSLVSTANGPTAANGIVVANGLGVAGTGGTLYVRQTANSANAGTISFYINLSPMPAPIL